MPAHDEDPDLRRLWSRHARLVDELDGIDDLFRASLGEQFEASVGAGMHRPWKDLDREAAELAAREETILHELRDVAVALAERGETVACPGPRHHPPGTALLFWRDWERLRQVGRTTPRPEPVEGWPT